MTLGRLGDPGSEIPVIRHDGRVYDLRPAHAGHRRRVPRERRHRPRSRRRCRRRAARIEGAAELRVAPPVARPGKIVCIGLNYHDHAEETGAARARRARRLHEGPLDGRRTVRRRADPAPIGEDRLGGRARRRDRHRGALPRVAREALAPRRRVRAVARRVGARVPARARRPVGQGQELRDLQPARTRPRARRRCRRPAGPRTATVGERRAAAERLDVRADLPGRPRDLVPVASSWCCTRAMSSTPARRRGSRSASRAEPYLREGDVVELEIDGLGRARQRLVQA